MASVVVSEKYKTLANSLTRQVETQAIIYDYLTSRKEWRYGRTYNDKSGIVSWSITGGKQSGAFEIGTAICKSLEIEFQRGATIGGNAKIDIQVRFVNPADLTDVSEWLSLGQFYADKITVTETSGIKKVVAMDYMLQLEKSYRTDMTYPLTPSLILNEIKEQAKFETAEDINIFNEPAVGTFPYKGQSQLGLRILYTRRQIIGFISSLQAANAYFTREGKLALTDYSNNDNDINVDDCYNMTTSGSDYNITNVVWSADGEDNASTVEDSYKILYFENPLDIAGQSRYNALTEIKNKIVGLNVRQISIEKQGTGLYELGEKVTVKDGENTFKIVICGIKYSMTSGGFRETLFSVAASENESNYDGGYTSGGSGNNSVTTILYQTNENPVVLDVENREVFSLQFSSVSNAAAVAAVTLNPTVTEGTEVVTTVFVDQKSYGEFTDVVELGKNVITVVCPLIGLPNGGHIISIQVKGAASATFAINENYLTLFANGVATEAGFTGVLELEERVPLMHISDDVPEIVFLPIKEQMDISVQEPIKQVITQVISNLTIDTQDIDVIFTPIGDYLGGKYVALFDSDNRPIYDNTPLRVFALSEHKKEENDNG